MSRDRCQVPTKRGAQCRAAPLTGYAFCAAHDPRRRPVEVLGGPLDGEALPARAGAVRKWGQQWRLTRKPNGRHVVRGEDWPVAGEANVGAYELVWLSDTVPKWLWNVGEHLDWYVERLTMDATR